MTRSAPMGSCLAPTGPGSGRFPGGWFSAVLAGCLACMTGHGQPLITDGTLGPRRSFDTLDTTIGADLGSPSGANLFHSFGRFNVPAGGSAVFAGPAHIQNIVVRVTGIGLPGGPEISRIDGRLGSMIDQANLYLLNPAGIVFGPGASLDLSGSFAVSTADYLRLGDHDLFDSRNPDPGVLSTAPPSAFGFVGSPATGIRIEGSRLEVASGRDLTMVAGGLETTAASAPASTAQLSAPGGRVTLAAANPDGEFPVQGSPPTALPEAGSVSLTAGSVVSAEPTVSGEASGTLIPDSDPATASAIFIRGGRITIAGNGTTLRNNAMPRHDPGRIDLQAGGSVEIRERARLLSDSGGEGESGPEVLVRGESIGWDEGARLIAGNGGSAPGPKVTLEADVVQLSGGANLVAQSYSTATGPGAQVSILARERFAMSGGAFLNLDNTGEEATATPPSLAITAKAIELTGTPGAGPTTRISAGSTGGKAGGGELRLTASRLALDQRARIQADTFTEARAGNIVVQADELTIQGGAQLRAIADVASHGGAGTIDISGLQDGQAARRVDLRGTGEISPERVTGILAYSEARGEPGALAPSGEIRIATDQLDITGSMIRATTIDAPGGRIRLTAGRVDLTDRGVIATSTSGQGTAGDLVIEARQVRIAGESGVSSSSTPVDLRPDRQPGIAGTVRIEALESLVLDHAPAAIRVEAPESRAGTIILRSPGTIDLLESGVFARGLTGGNIDILPGARFYALDSDLNASAAIGGIESQGNIRIPPPPGALPDWPSPTVPQVVVFNRSRLSANALQGQGGNIRVDARGFVRSADTTLAVSGTTEGVLDLPPLVLEIPPEPPAFQTAYDTPPVLEDALPLSIDDPEGYTRIGFPRSQPLRSRQLLNFGPEP